MNPKTFKASTAKLVLSQISRELGPDAIIVSHSKIQDSKGRLWVEATASSKEGAEIAQKIPTISEKITSKFLPKKLLTPALVLIALVAVFLISVFLINRPLSRKSIVPTHKQVVFTGNAYSPAISQDGKFIAYVNDEASYEEKVMVKDMASGQEIEVFSVDSHDSFVGELRWLPDGSELSILVWWKDEGPKIFIVPRLGGTARRLEGTPYFAWSPDGSRIAGTAPNWKEIIIRDVSSGETISVPLKGSFTFINGFDWSPTGKFLLFGTTDNEEHFTLWTITTDGSTQQTVVEDDDELSSPLWSHGGNTIFYFRMGAYLKELWKIPVSAETGKAIKSASLVLPNLQAGSYFSITVDGTKLLYTQGLQFANLWQVTVDGSGKDQKVKIKQLTRGTLWNKNPSISPDGSLVAFMRGDVKKSNIYVMPIEGGSPKQITFLNSLNDGPVWSPDGKEIAYGSNEGGEFKVWKVNAQGGRPFQFVRGQLSGSSRILAWFPGENILYLSPDKRNLFILNPDTEEDNPLLHDDSVGWVSSPRYSPDAQKVAIYWFRPSTSYDGLNGLWIIPLEDSSQAFYLAEDARPIGWSADGSWIYATERMARMLKILKVSIKGNQTQTVLTMPFPLEKGFPLIYEQVSMTADEKKFVFSVARSHSDVWMVENFNTEMK
jgi:Tol biopolymer transport system component